MLTMYSPASAAVQADPGDVAIPDGTNVGRLVDLSSDLLELSVEYDKRALQGLEVHIRSQSALSPDDLWTLTNDLLSSRGYVTIRRPDSPVISVVRTAEAAEQARLDSVESIDPRVWFAKIRVDVGTVGTKAAAELIKPALSKGAVITTLGDREGLIVADHLTRLRDAITIIAERAATTSSLLVERIPTQFVEAKQLDILLTTTVATRNTLTPTPLRGKASPSPDGASMLVIAPSDELPIWRSLIEQLDQRQPVTTVSHAVGADDLAEVATLIEATARDASPRGSGEQWSVVQNDLTGALVITATQSEHEAIRGVLSELAALPAEARRPVRTFAIRNRSVRELMETLTAIIDAGAIDAAVSFEPGPTFDASRARQRSERNVLPAQASAEPPSSPEAAPARSSRSAEPAALTLTVDEGTNTIIAVGDARQLARLEELIAVLDVRQPQVMLEVLIVSLSEGDTLDLGVELEQMGVSGGAMYSLGSLFGLSGGGTDPSTFSAGAGFTGLVLNPGDFRVLVRALQTLNEGRSLNIPKVLVNNNVPATLDSVLQQPFTSTNASDTVATTSFGGTEDAGTTITVTPQIAEGDHVVLEYAVSLSQFVGESSDPGLPPPRFQNTLESSVTIPDGYAIAVGGLETLTEAEAISQVPLLGDLPLIGEAFKNRSLSQSKTRFFVFVRPTILRHGGFEDLKYLSDQDLAEAQIDDGWPDLDPVIIR